MTSVVSDGFPSRRQSKPVPGARSSRSPVRVTAQDEPELLLEGLTALLRPYGARVRMVEPAASSDPDGADVILFDCFPDPQGAEICAARLPRATGAVTLAYSWHTRPALVRWALANGFVGYLSKALPAPELVASLEAACAGHTVIRPTPHLATRCLPGGVAVPADRHGLTPREGEVFALVCSGLSNAEIAQRLHLSPNSVKSYIRSAYRRIAVTTRSQAVVWGIEHGFGVLHGERVHGGVGAVDAMPRGGDMPGSKKPGPSVKDDETYEALRRQGESKEKSARIANAGARTSRKTVGRRGGKSPAYEDWSKQDLIERARQIGVEGRSTMSKSELIGALRNH
jgi:NarL family two-component system response regulator LiaR